jgi:hypothetical protein
VPCENLEDPRHWALDCIYLETLNRFFVACQVVRDYRPKALGCNGWFEELPLTTDLPHKIEVARVEDVSELVPKTKSLGIELAQDLGGARCRLL